MNFDLIEARLVGGPGDGELRTALKTHRFLEVEANPDRDPRTERSHRVLYRIEPVAGEHFAFAPDIEYREFINRAERLPTGGRPTYDELEAALGKYFADLGWVELLAARSREVQGGLTGPEFNLVRTFAYRQTPAANPNE